MRARTEYLGCVQVAEQLDGVSLSVVKRAARSGELRVATKAPGQTGAYLFHERDVALWARRRGFKSAGSA